MELEKKKTKSVLRDIGPFAQAKTNLDKFVWNFMIFYTTAVTIEAWKTAIDKPDAEAYILKTSAETTLRGLFDLILDRDDGVWD